jgi:hypothetical protein
MPPVLKATLGLLLALAAAWIWHAPLGHGERLIERLEAEARREVAKAELPGMKVNLSRSPLARTAILSGPANDLQREGLGSQKGVADYARDGRRVMPLLVETLAAAALAYLIGLGLGWLLRGRRRHEDFD